MLSFFYKLCNLFKRLVNIVVTMLGNRVVVLLEKQIS